MGFFAYQGQCPSGTAISGTIEAASFDEARSALEAMKLEAVELTEATPPKGKRSVGYEDFIFFNDQLASLASAGVALDDGLRQIAADLKSSRLRQVVNEIADDVQRGKPLADAVAAHESQLPVLYSRIVRAGVENGQLSATLMNLSQHLRLMAESRRVLFESLAYPLVVLVVALALFSFIIQWVIPQFESIYVDFDAVLPSLTMMMVDFAHVYPAFLAAVLVLILVVILVWIGLRNSPGGRRVREGLLLALPVAGGLYRASLLARFHRAVGLAIISGIPLPDTLRLAAGATGSPGLQDDADRLAERLEEGESVTTACQSTTLIPTLFGYVTDISRQRNTLPEAMVQLAEAYRLRAAHGVTLLRAWVVPLAFAILAFGVGVCILALFLPMVTLLNSIAGGG